MHGLRARSPRWVWSITAGLTIGATTAALLHPTITASGPSVLGASAPIAIAIATGPSTGPSVQRPSATPRPLDPTAFATGACTALAPTSGDQHLTVFLDAGHGGPDPGTASGTTQDGHGVEEKTVTVSVALDAAQQLRAAGYRVVLSRTGDTSVTRLTPADLTGATLSTVGELADLTARVNCANLSGAAVLVSIHFDAYSDPAVGGASTLYDTARPFSAANQTLATLLQQKVVTAVAASGRQVSNRGIASDATAGGGEINAAGIAYGHLDLLGPVDPGYVDHPSTMPGALVEPLFLTNPAEASAALEPAVQQSIAGGITDAIRAFLHHP
jgi:N-acetylmuramoyl-L-alanine amidase